MYMFPPVKCQAFLRSSFELVPGYVRHRMRRLQSSRVQMPRHNYLESGVLGKLLSVLKGLVPMTNTLVDSTLQLRPLSYTADTVFR